MSQQRKPRPTAYRLHPAMPSGAERQGLLSLAAAQAWMAAEAQARQAAMPMADQVAALTEKVEQLAGDLGDVSDFADGLLVVLSHLVPTILAKAPELAATLHPLWSFSSDRFEALAAGGPAMAGESIDLLDARRLLFRLCVAAGLWPGDGRGGA